MREHQDSSNVNRRDGRHLRRPPKAIAVINVDYCTGCEACIAVCPVDCIKLIETELRVKGVHSWCEIELDRCIGCALCVQVPKPKDAPYRLKICPWDAIEMIPTEHLPEAIPAIGGPDWYVTESQPRLLETACRLARERSGRRS